MGVWQRWHDTVRRERNGWEEGKEKTGTLEGTKDEPHWVEMWFHVSVVHHRSTNDLKKVSLFHSNAGRHIFPQKNSPPCVMVLQVATANHFPLKQHTHTHHFAPSHTNGPSLHIWRTCICHTFPHPFIKAWISVRASVNIHFLQSFFSFSIALDPFPGSKPSLHPLTSSVYLSPSSVFRPTFNLIVEKTTSASPTSSWTFTGEKKSSFCELTWWRCWTSEDTHGV